MTDQEKISKLEQVIEEAFVAFGMLPEMTVCSACNTANQEMLDRFYKQVEIMVNLKKEIV